MTATRKTSAGSEVAQPACVLSAAAPQGPIAARPTIGPLRMLLILRGAVAGRRRVRLAYVLALAANAYREQGAPSVWSSGWVAGREMAGNRFLDEGVEALFALWVLACHLAVAVGALIGVWLVEFVIRTLWPGSEPTIFGKVPLRMIIEAADAGILIVFLAVGVYRAARTTRT